MARKATTSKSAAKKPDARKHAAPKTAARPSPSPAKAVPRTGLAHAPVHQADGQVLAKGAPKPVAAKAKAPSASKAPLKRPVAAAKAPIKPAGSPAANAIKPASPKAAVPPAQAHAPRPVGQPAAALAAAKSAAQKTMLPGHPPAAGKQAGAAAAPAAANKKPVNQRHGFKTNEWIVYPAHGVGRIVGIEEQEIAGISLELFVITFEKDKMTLRVPTGKSQSVGMRKLAEEPTLKKAMETLRGKARVKRTMWSRRAQEYEAKINSGDLISIAEVVRDLYRSESQPEQSYSERQLYEAALDRMARELAAVEKLDERGAVQRITEVLAKSAKGRRVTAEEAEVKAA